MAEPTLLERCIAFAVERHAGQFDKAGAPYILHSLRVMLAVKGEDARCVAVLHDVIEDTDATFVAVEALGISRVCMGALYRLTRDPGEPYEGYITHIRSSPLACQVKLADLADNLDITRLPRMTEKDWARHAKYLHARAILETPED